MPLVKSPAMTPRKLAASRANGRRSAGPRTSAGKDRVVLNALKHGGYSRAFRSNLLRAGEDVALYDWIYARVCESFRPVGKQQWRDAERLARQTWCRLRREGAGNGASGRPLGGSTVWSLAWTPWRRGGLEMIPRYAVKSTRDRLAFQSSIRIIEPRSGFRLMFWVRRPRRVALPWIPLTTCAELGSWLMATASEGRRQAKTCFSPSDGGTGACAPPGGRGLKMNLRRITKDGT